MEEGLSEEADALYFNSFANSAFVSCSGQSIPLFIKIPPRHTRTSSKKLHNY